MHIPRFTRILVITDESSPHREFTISHRMVMLLAILGILLAGLMAAVLLSYSGLLLRTNETADLNQRLARAEAELAAAGELAVELEQMRGLQARLLYMLGVEPLPADEDSLAPGLWLEGADPRLEAAAGAVLMPPPDRWPSAGFVTQEFEPGATARGIKPHLGLDIAGPVGTPVLAAGDGRVVRVGTDPYLGNFVEVQHGLSYLTVYAHCRDVVVRPGASVRSGQIIAYMGESGEVSACHLHFEIWQDGEAVDPRQFLRGDPPQT